MKLTIQILRVAVLSMLMGSAGADINRIELPDLGDPAESALSISKEREIGLEIMQQIRQQHVTVDDLIVYEYINSIGHQLVSNADSALHDFSFFVIRDNSINEKLTHPQEHSGACECRFVFDPRCCSV